MQILWKNICEKNDSKNWVFKTSPESNKNLQETNQLIASVLENKKNSLTENLAGETKDNTEKALSIKDYKEALSENQGQLIESLAKNDDFFNGEIGKEQFMNYMKEQLGVNDIPFNKKFDLDDKLRVLHVHAQFKNQENQSTNAESFTNRNALEKELWQQGKVSEGDIKKYITENQDLLTDKEKNLLNQDSEKFWKIQAESLKK